LCESFYTLEKRQWHIGRAASILQEMEVFLLVQKKNISVFVKGAVLKKRSFPEGEQKTKTSMLWTLLKTFLIEERSWLRLVSKARVTSQKKALLLWSTDVQSSVGFIEASVTYVFHEMCSLSLFVARITFWLVYILPIKVLVLPSLWMWTMPFWCPLYIHVFFHGHFCRGYPFVGYSWNFSFFDGFAFFHLKLFVITMFVVPIFILLKDLKGVHDGFDAFMMTSDVRIRIMAMKAPSAIPWIFYIVWMIVFLVYSGEVVSSIQDGHKATLDVVCQRLMAPGMPCHGASLDDVRQFVQDNSKLKGLFYTERTILLVIALHEAGWELPVHKIVSHTVFEWLGILWSAAIKCFS
jgi:hypothetical protein